MLEGLRGIRGKVKRWRIHLELLGEIPLLAIVGGFFVYLFAESLSWPLGAALMPRIAVIIGFPFLIIRVITLLRHTAAQQGPIQIMDMGFSIGIDPEGEAKRFVRICTFIIGLYLAIWVFGFHVALPLACFFIFSCTAGWAGSHPLRFPCSFSLSSLVFTTMFSMLAGTNL